MEVFRINNIKKTFDGNEVLKNITVAVNPGEVVAIIGPSGSGKSTLLRCATLLETMDEGELIYGGKKIAFMENGKTHYASPHDLREARSSFGLVFQNFNLFPHFSVMRNLVDAPLSVQKREKGEVLAEARALLAKMGLADKENAYPYQLSGGQQQRVSIARALMMNPSILFFDEPTSALDPELTGDILKVIRDLAAEHMTMVIVTHEIEFAKHVSDRIIFMADGVIVEEGDAKEIVENPKHERTRAFLGKFQR